MTLSDLANLSTIAQAVLVVISLGFIWYQLRQSIRLASAANAQSLTEHAATFNSLLIQNAELADLWYTAENNLANMEPASRRRYREMLVQWLIFHENIHHQWRKGLLDREIYATWLEDLKFTVTHHPLEVVSSNIADFFPGEYGRHIERLKKMSTSS